MVNRRNTRPHEPSSMKTSLAGKHALQAHRKRAKAEQRSTTKHAKHHKRRHKHKRQARTPCRAKPHGTLAIALPSAPASPPAPSPAPVQSLGRSRSRSPRRTGCCWRAGFGPTPGQAEALVGQPLEQVVFGLTRPSGPATLSGPEPVDEEGDPLDPDDAWGEDHCWWLDRMIRSDQQLVERMTFIFHDWFANSNEKVNSQQMMLEQNELFRRWRSAAFTTCSSRSPSTPRCSCSSTGSTTKRATPTRTTRAR